MKKIVVVGSLNMDFIIEIEKMPLPGETILGKSLTLVPGGKGANQAYAIGKLGGHVQMIGAIGNDTYGKRIIENLGAVGVDTDGITILEGEPTGNAYIPVNEMGENSIIVVQGANGKLSKEMVEKHIQLLDECEIVILQLEIPIEVVSFVVAEAKRRGKTVILDPAPARTDIPTKILENVDILKPNETELQTLVGGDFTCKEDYVKGARLLIEKGVSKVIVTLGEKGSLLVTKEEVKTFPANKVSVVDTTGAGDSFIAAFSLALSIGLNDEEAITFGNKVSSIVVTRNGAQTSIPTMNEIEKSL